MANDSDKPNVLETAPPAPPAEKPTAPETTSQAPPADKLAPKPERPADKRPFKRGGGEKDRGPRQRERGPMPSLDSDMLYKQKTGPNVRDLDAEIAAELEAALQGIDDKSLYGADSSKRAGSNLIPKSSPRAGRCRRVALTEGK